MKSVLSWRRGPSGTLRNCSPRSPSETIRYAGKNPEMSDIFKDPGDTGLETLSDLSLIYQYGPSKNQTDPRE